MLRRLATHLYYRAAKRKRHEMNTGVMMTSIICLTYLIGKVLDMLDKDNQEKRK